MAGPAAVALEPRRDATLNAKTAGLEEKNGRLLLREQIDDPAERLSRVATLLEELTP